MGVERLLAVEFDTVRDAGVTHEPPASGPDRLHHRLSRADALQHRVIADSLGQIFNSDHASSPRPVTMPVAPSFSRGSTASTASAARSHSALPTTPIFPASLLERGKRLVPAPLWIAGKSATPGIRFKTGKQPEPMYKERYEFSSIPRPINCEPEQTNHPVARSSKHPPSPYRELIQNGATRPPAQHLVAQTRPTPTSKGDQSRLQTPPKRVP